jgi:hypothetical protein
MFAGRRSPEVLAPVIAIALPIAANYPIEPGWRNSYSRMHDSQPRVTIGPMHNDVLGMALMEVGPLLTRIDPEIEIVEVREILRQLGRDAFDFRGRRTDLGPWPSIGLGSHNWAYAGHHRGSDAGAERECSHLV